MNFFSRFLNRLGTGVMGFCWALLSLHGKPHPHERPPFPVQGLILNQKPFTDEKGRQIPGDFPWGKKGNLKANGCGPIAVYNLLTGLKGRLPLEVVLRDLEMKGAPAFQGRFGANILVLVRYLKEKGLDTQRYSITVRGHWELLSLNADGLLLLVQFPNCFHYIAGIRVGEEGFRFPNPGFLTGYVVGKVGEFEKKLPPKSRIMEMIVIKKNTLTSEGPKGD